VQHLAEQPTYAYLEVPNFVPTMQYRGTVRITRATGAVAVLEQGVDCGLVWRALPIEAASAI
jgi:hypothetical protein